MKINLGFLGSLIMCSIKEKQRLERSQTRSFHPDVANVKRDKELHPT